MTQKKNAILDCIRQVHDVHVVSIPGNLNTKLELLECLKIGLKFPHGYGTNWDAFDESITDLSWLAQRNILLAHDDFPRLEDKDFNIYLTTLREAIEFWRQDGSKNLLVSFGI